MGYTRPEFQIQGTTLRMKPTSPKNLQKLRSMEEDIDIDTLDEGEQYIEMLKIFTEPVDGSYSDIDPEDIDMRKVEHYMMDFLPGQRVM